jgi:acyl-homoserine-lactone acylase
MKPQPPAAWRRHRWRALVPAAVAAAVLAATLTTYAAAAGGVAAQRGASRYQATIVRTAYGIPHITAHDFGSLGFGYGYALASDDLCTMANGYVTLTGQRSRYFGPRGSYTSAAGTMNNLDSDIFWRSVSQRHVISRLLSVRQGPGAVPPQARTLMAGYVAGYNHYLALAGGSKGISDPVCRGKPWVKPITLQDAYLRVYAFTDLEGQAAFGGEIASAHPPSAVAGGQAASPGPSLGAGTADAAGSNALAVGSAGTRGHAHGMLLGNPHFPWDGPDRFYQVQLTVPGTMNVEGATLYGFPLVVVGFTRTLAWTHTTSTTLPDTVYQVSLVPGHPTQYRFQGRAVNMTRTTVTVASRTPAGKPAQVHRTLWSTRWGPVISSVNGLPLNWTAKTAYALADSNASNFRLFHHFLATDEARSVPQELSVLRRYEGVPWANTVAADQAGRALYADIGSFPDVTDTQAAQCSTALGTVTLREAGLAILDGSRASCAPGTDRDSAAPGIFGGHEEPTLIRRDFVENSNDSYWLTNPAHPLTGFPRVIGTTGTARTLRTRSALTMVMARINGTDGQGPAGFTLGSLKHLMYADIQYGASLVKRQLVAMCRSFPGGRAPTSSGTIAVGNSCQVLAAWDGTEQPGSRGAVLFRDFWNRALALSSGPWAKPFTPASPVTTPSGLDTAKPGVQRAYGNALAGLTAAHLPYGVPLSAVQFVVRDGTRIPLPGGPGDPLGEFNSVASDITHPGTDPSTGASYLQAVTWQSGPCPVAATLVAYSESGNPTSPHYADQTRLFSRRQWAPAYFCRTQVAAHTTSTTTVRGGPAQ